MTSKTKTLELKLCFISSEKLLPRTIRTTKPPTVDEGVLLIENIVGGQHNSAIFPLRSLLSCESKIVTEEEE